MNHNDIISSIQSYPITIILVLNKNTNPDALVLECIKKISNNANIKSLDLFPDLVKLNGNKSSIKKDEIIKMKNDLNYSSIENSQYKFFYIKKIENASKEVFNTLLKFIEDMNFNNVGFLTTNDLNLIPNTIKSRCCIFYLDKDLESTLRILEKYHLSNDKWLLNLFNDNEELENFIQSDNFELINNLFSFFINVDFLKSKYFFDKFKILNYSEIKFLIESLMNYKNEYLKVELIELLNSIKYNPTKSLIFIKLLNIMENM